MTERFAIEKLEQGTGNKGTGQARANPAPKPTQSVPITKPQAKPIVEKAASPTEAPQAAPVQAAPLKREAESQSDSFLEHLSPGSRGMYISSQAKLVKVEGAIAQMQMPDKFKFLKAKLESRSAEILEAIVKSSGQSVQSLNIEVVEVVNLTASNP